jgi:hypothetical protein
LCFAQQHAISHIAEHTPKMSTSDLDQLIEMGFEPERSKLAVKKTGGRTFCPALLL